MNCYSSGLLGLGLLAATFSTMSVTEEQHNKLKNELSPELDLIYDNIASERRNLYIQGLLIGLTISYFLSKIFRMNNLFHRLTFFIGITISISVLYYFIMPKSDYMLNHLKTPAQNKAWLEIYKTMKNRYVIGFLIGSLSAIPISYALC